MDVKGTRQGRGKKRRHPEQCRMAWHEVKSAVIVRLEDQAATHGGRGWLFEKQVVVREPQTDPVGDGRVRFGCGVVVKELYCIPSRA